MSSIRVRRCLPLLLLATLDVSPAAAQESTPEEETEGVEDERRNLPSFLRLSYQPSWVHPTNAFLQGDNAAMQPIDSGQAFKIEIGWQTDGSADWEQDYEFPAIGIGFYKASFDDRGELGGPAAFYGWFSWPLARMGKRLILTTDIGTGIAFNWNPLSEDNPFNRAVSTRVTFYSDWGVYLHYRLSPRIALRGGLVYNHFSNGGTSDPNLGLNTLAPVLGLGVDFGASGGEHSREPRREQPPFVRSWELGVTGSGGWKGVRLEEEVEWQKRFGLANVTLNLQRHLVRKGKLGGGLDVTYDASANAEEALETGRSDKLALGLYGGVEWVIGRFSILAHLGRYLWRGRKDERVPALYQRLGFRFRIGSHLVAGMNIRFFDFGTADFIEWSLGYVFHWPDASGSEHARDK